MVADPPRGQVLAETRELGGERLELGATLLHRQPRERAGLGAGVAEDRLVAATVRRGQLHQLAPLGRIRPLGVEEEPGQGDVQHVQQPPPRQGGAGDRVLDQARLLPPGRQLGQRARGRPERAVAVVVGVPHDRRGYDVDARAEGERPRPGRRGEPVVAGAEAKAGGSPEVEADELVPEGEVSDERPAVRRGKAGAGLAVRRALGPFEPGLGVSTLGQVPDRDVGPGPGEGSGQVGDRVWREGVARAHEAEVRAGGSGGAGVRGVVPGGLGGEHPEPRVGDGSVEPDLPDRADQHVQQGVPLRPQRVETVGEALLVRGLDHHDQRDQSDLRAADAEPPAQRGPDPSQGADPDAGRQPRRASARRPADEGGADHDAQPSRATTASRSAPLRSKSKSQSARKASGLNPPSGCATSGRDQK